MTLRIGIDVGGTNTDAVLLAEDRTVLAAVKRPTTSDIESGVRAALEAVLEGQDLAAVQQAMLGTTQCTNAIVERRGLRRVGVLRIGAPATTAVPPLADWPADLREAALADARVIGGGHHFDGREIAPLDVAAVRRAAQDWQGTVEAVAVSSVFSPADSGHEAQAREILREHLDVPISISSEIGSIGLLERENATVMNAALTGVAERATRGFTQALAAAGVQATPFLSQNDGTLMTLALRRRVPRPHRGLGPDEQSARRRAALRAHRRRRHRRRRDHRRLRRAARRVPAGVGHRGGDRRRAHQLPDARPRLRRRWAAARSSAGPTTVCASAPTASGTTSPAGPSASAVTRSR